MKKFPRLIIYLTGGFIGLAFVASLLVHNYVACVWEAIAFMWFALASFNRSIIERQSRLINSSLDLLREQQDILTKISNTIKSNEPTE